MGFTFFRIIQPKQYAKVGHLASIPMAYSGRLNITFIACFYSNQAYFNPHKGWLKKGKTSFWTQHQNPFKNSLLKIFLSLKRQTVYGHALNRRNFIFYPIVYQYFVIFNACWIERQTRHPFFLCAFF